MTTYADLTFYDGEDWIIDFTVADEDEVAIDITSATHSFRIANDSGALITATGGSGVTEVVPASGTVRIDITPAMQTSGSTVAGETYRYEYKVTLASGEVTTQAAGTLHVKNSLQTEF